MTWPTTERGAERWHALLLALAGRIDDAGVAAARAATADDGRFEAVVHGLRRAGATVSRTDVRQLVATAEPADPAALAEALTGLGLPPSAHLFQPMLPGVVSPHGVLTGGVDLSDVDAREWGDPLVAAAFDLADGEPGVRGLWAAVRDTADPVFLVEVDDQRSTVDLTGKLQALLTRAGAAVPRAEVFRTGDRLPDYQRGARAQAALLWALTAKGRPELVPVFDAVHPERGPQFDDVHERLSTTERSEVAGYLLGASTVLLITATMPDVLEPERGEVVPLTFRTDGEYVWPEAVAYYAQRYGLAPYRPLLDTIRAAGYRPPVADGIAVFRAERAVAGRATG